MRHAEAISFKVEAPTDVAKDSRRRRDRGPGECRSRRIARLDIHRVGRAVSPFRNGQAQECATDGYRTEAAARLMEAMMRNATNESASMNAAGRACGRHPCACRRSRE